MYSVLSDPQVSGPGSMNYYSPSHDDVLGIQDYWEVMGPPNSLVRSLLFVDRDLRVR